MKPSVAAAAMLGRDLVGAWQRFLGGGYAERQTKSRRGGRGMVEAAGQSFAILSAVHNAGSHAHKISPIVCGLIV